MSELRESYEKKIAELNLTIALS